MTLFLFHVFSSTTRTHNPLCYKWFYGLSAVWRWWVSLWFSFKQTCKHQQLKTLGALQSTAADIMLNVSVLHIGSEKENKIGQRIIGI